MPWRKDERQAVAERVAEDQLLRLEQFLTAQIGSDFSSVRKDDLSRGIASAAREFGAQDEQSFIQWLLSTPLRKDQIETLASHFTVGETYFFRDKRQFEILETKVLPELIHSRRKRDQRLRIWSAGCCTGEEPYSIAILLHRMLPDLKGWNIAILAADINPRFLQKAAAGIYTGWSFRETPEWVRDGYFTRTPQGHFQIVPSIKKMVTFAGLNLVQDACPSLANNTNAMDVILCRNVLMYFAPEPSQRTIHNLYCSLVEGGWLLVNPSETSSEALSQFVRVSFPGATFFKKDSSRSQRAERSRPTQDFYPLPHEVTKGLFPRPMDPVSEQEKKAPVTRGSRNPLPTVAPQGAVGGKEFPPFEPKAETDVGNPLDIEASLLYARGRYAEAAQQLLRLLSQEPDDSQAIALLVRSLANQGKLAEALEWSEKLAAADKLNPGSHYLRAAILQELGQLEEARNSLKRALYLDPSFVLAHFALGNLTRGQGRAQVADRHFKNALSLLCERQQEAIVAESDGITVGRFREIIESFGQARKVV